MPRLWELTEDDFPCPFADNEQDFGSWEALCDNADAFDDDLNIVIWWGWSPPYDGHPSERITLYVAMPNRERVYPWTAPVTRDQEPEIRAWLQRRLARLNSWWNLQPAEGDA